MFWKCKGMNPLQASAVFFFVVVPHITDAIQDWVTRVSGEPVEKDTNADVCIIEVSEQGKSIVLLHLWHFHSPATGCKESHFYSLPAEANIY